LNKSIATVLIIFAALASYAPAAGDGFVWDDTALVLRDPLIRSWRLIPEGFNHFLFVDATASDFYRPLQRLTYTLEYAAFGFTPGPYHVTNILLHAGAAVALLFFADELLLVLGVEAKKRRWGAFLSALVWTIHPIHSAAVVYVSGRADPLAAGFGFLGCYLLIRHLRAGARRELIWLVPAAVALLLSALSKETGLIFPVLAIAIFALTKNSRVIWKAASIAALIGAAYFSLRLAAHHNPAPVPQTSIPLAVRPISMARAFAEYAGLIAFPLNLHMERQIDAQPSPPAESNVSHFAWRELQTILGLGLIAATIFWTVRARRRNPPVYALLILAFISYLPVSGIITLNAAVAEHWIYLPSAFLFLAIALAVAQEIEIRRVRRIPLQAARAVFACWVAFLVVRTGVRTLDWKDQRTFLERTIAGGGNSARMLINLAGLESSEGKLDLARRHLTLALRKEPDQPLAILNLAAVASRQNDFKTARELATRATHLPLVDAQAHELLAVLENKEHGRADLLRLRLAARTGPANWAIEKRYVQLIDETGSTTRAIKELETCLETEWYRAESWQLLSQLLSKIGLEKEAAVAHAQAAAYDVHLRDAVKLL
jgi:tetratricopeptide (TPR) repeat protein